MAEDAPTTTDACPTHYALLGVGENASAEELKVAYRQKALLQHPDKGGDENRFHELQQAYKVLEDVARREAYDETLRQQRDRAQLVEGGPAATKTRVAAREKTAPTPGSKRSKLVLARGGEWAKLGTGAGALKAIEDGVSKEAKTQMLFAKYAALPRDKDKKREWLQGVRGEDKAALKACAKAHEKAQMAKWDKWLGKA
mmetsp:Transcript_159866/g.298114  ORF Transcript_159866/g.298114 Transcript_159866/m.298114 type:complete len:199 (+) Transcript_159866:77-673(+)